ncbi:MAG: hypothetical protein ACO1RX_20835 [Candidatus Sericytochromatia bacterium]
MKGLVICRDRQAEALGVIQPGVSPWLLPVAGKPLVSYALETLARLGVQEVRLLTDTPDLEARLGDGQQLGLKLSYAPLPQEASLEALFVRNRSFLSDADVVVMEGLQVCAPRHAPHCLRLTRSLRLGPDVVALRAADLAEGLSACAARLAQLPTEAWIEVLPIRDLASYLDANFTVLAHWRGRISLPAYGEREGFLLGGQVELAADVQLQGVGLLGHASSVQARVQLRQVCLGERVVLGEGTRLARTVVLNDSWVGPGLWLEGKIVSGRRLIDVATGTVLDLAEPGWLDDLRPVSEQEGWGSRLFAGLVCLLQAPLLWALPPMSQTPYRGLRGEVRLPETAKLPAWARRWGLDRHFHLRAVVRGDLALLGQPPVPLHTPPAAAYLPAAFSYASYLGSSGEQALLDNTAYPLLPQERPRWQMVLQILWRSLTRGPLSGHDDAQKVLAPLAQVPDHPLPLAELRMGR